MEKVVVSYRDPDDPPESEIVALEKKLEGFAVLDRMPGSILLEGKLEHIRARLNEAGCRWSASPVRRLKG